MRELVAGLDGGGWGLAVPQRLLAPVETLEVAAGEPEALEGLLRWLDRVASSGDPLHLAVGFLSYEAGVWLEGSRELFRPPERTPLAAFGLFDAGGGPSSGAPVPPRHRGTATGPAVPALDRETWAAAVESIRAGIERGDVYQVNLTRRVTLPVPVAPFDLAAALHADNPVPYAITLAADGWAVVSNSPELFLDVDLGAGTARSAPIKGTVPRGPTPEEDAAARERLLLSEKDAAEHLMIVDLIRNDLGRVSVPGGVAVPALRSLLTFSHLHHLESTVAGRLRPGTRLSDVLRATLPGGSVTGAPKRASLGFVRRLEPTPRGPYTGAAGWVRGDGRAVLNVAIRTAVVSPAGVDYHAGGGIVWDSDAAREWEEAETKSREFTRALAALAPPAAP